MLGELNLSPTVWSLAGVVFAVALLFLWSQFNEEARLRRRRRKNYGSTVSKAKGPSIKLAVNAEEPKE
jgi:protein-S-isoprenylcysteine O-methyltransferase Ste14